MDTNKKLEIQIRDTKTKINFAFKFARLSLLAKVYDLIDFNNYLTGSN